MTISLDNRGEISLHPLDLTVEPPNNPNAQDCIGMIQAADSTLTSPTSDIGDMILGVPFMRNAYSVLSYQIPDINGRFDNDTNPNDASVNSQIQPRLGLMALTDPTVAMDEFHTVRILNQPLEPNHGQATSAVSSGKKISVGIDVLLGLVGFFGLCVILFALRWWFTKRGWNRAAAADVAGDTTDVAGVAGYPLKRRDSRSSQPSNNSTLRTLGSTSSKKRFTMSSGQTTQVDDRDGDVDGEFGLRTPSRREAHNVNDPWDPRNYSMAFRDSLFEPDPVHTPPRTPEPAREAFLRPDHQRTTSELRNNPQGVLAPLLAHTKGEPRADDLAEFGLANLSSMAGVGTAARGSKIDAGFRRSTVGSVASNATTVRSASPQRQASLSPRPFSGMDVDTSHGL